MPKRATCSSPNRRSVELRFPFPLEKTFSYGDDPGYIELPNYAWYDQNSYTTNKPAWTSYYFMGRYYATWLVGQKLPTPWGLYDMYGELSEWCQDWFGFYTGGAVMDPKGPATGTDRILRSGSWFDDPYTMRSAFRYFIEPDDVSGIYGFRVASLSALWVVFWVRSLPWFRMTSKCACAGPSSVGQPGVASLPQENQGVRNLPLRQEAEIEFPLPHAIFH
ncbi:MAG TPA: SUMF1/EgtB/PvdO family nonheme iron enzyme [Verrucomicrobiae bacterium]|nr:SUMF1/EgtB/PvdO family nonheme iron enzyme [Verrucomicrobiae bacterium]